MNDAGADPALSEEVPPVVAAPVVAAPVVAAPAPDITLEFCLPPSGTRRLWRSRTLTPLRAGRTRTQTIRIVWHETAGDTLAGSGRALLEIRLGASAAWQMQRTVRDGTLAWPLGTPAPPSDDPGIPQEATRPVAVFEGHSRTLPLSSPGGPLAMTLLEGSLTAGSVAQEEARLSLRGSNDDVFALARALLEELPLRVAAGSLSADVRGLLHGRLAPPPPVLRAELDVDDAFAHVVSQLGACLAFHAPAARAGTAIEPVHQMRVALRRLRSAMSLFGRIASSPALDRARRDLGGLARALGPARDWDVFLAGTGREVARLLPEEKAVARLNAAARRRRRAAYAGLAQLLDGPDFQRILLDLVELAVVRPWARDAAQDRPRLTAFARHALDRKLRQVTEAGEDLSALTMAELHALRIRCKRLRYAAEFFAPLASARQARRFLRRLAAVQERLGLLNDGAVAGELLAELGGRGFAAGIIHGYLAARSAGGRAKATRSWRKLRKTEPFWD